MKDLYAIIGLSLVVVGVGMSLAGYFSSTPGISGDTLFLLFGPPIFILGIGFSAIAVIITRRKNRN